jgi:hypothetical protein
MRHICLEQPEKSVVAEHWIDTAHNIHFNGISILGMAARYMNYLVREAIKIQLHPNNFNGDEGCHPVINVLKLSIDTPMGKQGQTELGS